MVSPRVAFAIIGLTAAAFLRLEGDDAGLSPAPRNCVYQRRRLANAAPSVKARNFAQITFGSTSVL